MKAMEKVKGAYQSCKPYLYSIQKHIFTGRNYLIYKSVVICFCVGSLIGTAIYGRFDIQNKKVHLDGNTYLFKNGELQAGLVEYEGKTYFCNNEGKLLTGWVSIDDNTWKYFDTETGEGVSGTTEILGETYTFDKNGDLKKGIQDTGEIYTEKGEQLTSGIIKMNNEVYVLDEDGKFITGWINDTDGTDKYFKNDGAMAVGETVIDDKKFNFQSDGSLLKGWQTTEIEVNATEEEPQKTKTESLDIAEIEQSFQEVSLETDDKTGKVNANEVKTDEMDSKDTETNSKSNLGSNNTVSDVVDTSNNYDDDVKDKTSNSVLEVNKETKDKSEDKTSEKQANSDTEKKEEDKKEKPKTKTVKMYFDKYGYPVKDKIQTIDEKDYAFDKNGYLITKTDSKYFINEDGTARLLSDYEKEQEEAQKKWEEEQAKWQKEQQKLLAKQKEEAKNTKISNSDNSKDFTAEEMQTMVNTAYANLGVNQTCTWLSGKCLASVLGGNWNNYVFWPEEYPSRIKGRWVSQAEARPGCLLIYSGHIAVYVGNGKAIHSGWCGYQTVLSTVSCSNALIGYYQPQH